jgi:hypothetical protein
MSKKGAEVNVLCEGWLLKQSGDKKKWQSRYFVLRDDLPLIYYFDKKEKSAHPSKAKGNIDLTKARIVTAGDGGSLLIKVGLRDWCLMRDTVAAHSPAPDAQAWIDAMAPVLEKFQKRFGQISWEELTGNPDQVATLKYYTALGKYDAAIRIQQRGRGMVVRVKAMREKAGALISRIARGKLGRKEAQIVKVSMFRVHMIVWRFVRKAKRKVQLRKEAEAQAEREREAARLEAEELAQAQKDFENGVNKTEESEAAPEEAQGGQIEEGGMPVGDRWGGDLDEGETVLMEGPIRKSGDAFAMGRKQKRHLLLTTQHRLLYFDTSKAVPEFKGEILGGALVRVQLSGESTLELVTKGRTYFFEMLAEASEEGQGENSSQHVGSSVGEKWLTALQQLVEQNHGTITICGYLEKRATSKAKRLAFKKRYFSLTGAMLTYREKESSAKNKGEIRIAHDSMCRVSDDTTRAAGLCLEVKTSDMPAHHKLLVATSDKATTDKWVAAITAVIEDEKSKRTRKLSGSLDTFKKGKPGSPRTSSPTAGESEI